MLLSTCADMHADQGLYFPHMHNALCVAYNFNSRVQKGKIDISNRCHMHSVFLIAKKMVAMVIIKYT